MIEWFLIGCAVLFFLIILLIILLVPILIWVSLSDKAQWIVLAVISFIVLAALLGIVAFAFYGGIK